MMVHLPVHLVDELELGGPVQFRWMYSVERYLYKLKCYVRNRSRPEASIAEGYLVEEALTFCSRYMNENVDTRLNRPTRNYASGNEEDMAQRLFPFVGRPLGVRKNGKGKLVEMDRQSLACAHRYVLFNCHEIQEFIDEHYELTNNKKHQNPPTPSLKALTPSFSSSKDQNPVMGYVEYYGVVREIIQLNYSGHYQIVLFRCDWFQHGVNDFGQTVVNFDRMVCRHDPYVMATQVQQVFYVRDPREPHLYFAMKVLPRDYSDDVDGEDNEIVAQPDIPIQSEMNTIVGIDDVNEIQLAVLGEKGTTIKIPFSHFDSTNQGERNENDASS